MAGFDEYIGRVGRYVAGLERQGRAVEQIAIDPRQDSETLCVNVGPGSNPGVILRSDTFAELGAPDLGSCGMTLWTSTVEQVHDGRITLVGPDISGEEPLRLPFAQVVLVGGRKLTADDHRSIVQSQYVADQIEGFMVRSSSTNLWCRVSQDAVRKGFRLDTLGHALMLLVRGHVPEVEAVEVLFVTSSKEDVRRLVTIADDVRDVGKQMVEEYWKSKGYDLDCDMDCGSCADQEACDGIRDIISIRAKKTSAGNGKDT